MTKPPPKHGAGHPSESTLGGKEARLQRRVQRGLGGHAPVLPDYGRVVQYTGLQSCRFARRLHRNNLMLGKEGEDDHFG